jgi:hypothetical protein
MDMTNRVLRHRHAGRNYFGSNCGRDRIASGTPHWAIGLPKMPFRDLSNVLRRLLDERAIFVCRAEIDIDAFDPVTIEGEKLRVPEILAAFGHAPIGHKRLIAVDEDLFSSSWRSIQSLLRQQRAK